MAPQESDCLICHELETLCLETLNILHPKLSFYGTIQHMFVIIEDNLEETIDEHCK